MDTPEPQPVVVVPISAPEFAAATGYDVATVCRWAKAGTIPVIRKLPGPRGAYLIDPRGLALVRHKTAKTPPPGATTPPGGVPGQLELPTGDER